MTDYKYIGKNIPREDALSRVTGQAKFVTDMVRHNMLYGKLVLSEHPHAEVSFDMKETLEVPGVFAVLTHEDFPKVGYNSMEWFTGVNGNKDEYALNDRARFVGDRIALVLGESKLAVEKGIKKLKVYYDDLPSFTGVEEAKRDEIIIRGESNHAFHKEISCGDYQRAKEKATYVVRDTGHTPRTHHVAIETHSALAEIDDFGNLVVSSANQVVFAIQMHLSRILNLPYAKIRVIKANMGGSFGGKQQPLLEIIAACAAWKYKRPILLYMDRKQSMIGTFVRNTMDISVETAVSSDGKILGRSVQTEVDGGGYDTNNVSIVNAFAKKLFRLYKIDNQSFVGDAYYSNAVPGGACRAYGGPQAHAVAEINMTNTAYALGMDPCEFRMKNLIDPYDDDKVGGPNLGKAYIKQCLSEGMKEFHWKEKFQHIKERDTHRYAYGVGVACASHGNGYLGAFSDFTNVELILTADGSVLAKIAVHEQGCGTIASLKQILAEAICLDPEHITLTEADTFITPYDAAGTQASRVSFVCGGALKEAGEALMEKLKDTLEKVEGVHRKDLIFDKGKVTVKGRGTSYSYGEIATMREKSLHDPATVYIHHTPKGNPAALAACFAQVKVDKLTGFVEVEEFLSCHDIGKAIHPQMVEGQVHGGCNFVLGMALSEEIEIDGKGYVKNPTLSKYHVINVQDMPNVKVKLIESEDESAPYGLKSIGEVSAVAPAPAVLNAINHALGTNITDYPATPEKIIKHITHFRKE